MNTVRVDGYVKDIAEKAFGSRALADLALPTLNREYVRKLPGGLHVLQIPRDYLLVAHSSGGNMRVREGVAYAESVFNALLEQAKSLGATPIATASVIDAQSTDEAFVQRVGGTYAALAKQHNVAILNGELAKYGPMVNCECNIAGTMLSLVRRDTRTMDLPGVLNKDGTLFFVFDPKGKFVWMNSDGTGTKTLSAVRFPGRVDYYRNAVDDVLAMQADDWGRFGMTQGGSGPLAFLNILERTGGYIPFVEMYRHAASRAQGMSCASILIEEDVGDRLIGPDGEENPFNISGTLVSAFAEEDLERMPKPSAGDTLIAIKAKGGRSNGFTDRRNIMVRSYGKEWHKTATGKAFGEFLVTPSIIFYPVFVDLISKGLATAVFHMSGGAYRDKLSGILAKHELYAEIGIANGSEQLFDPDLREVAFAGKFRMADAYTKFAVGNEGFVTTRDPENTIGVLRAAGLEAKAVATLESRSELSGIKLRAFNGEIVDFTSRKELAAGEHFVE